MAAVGFTESVVEEAALEWLQGLGYEVLHGPDIAPGSSFSERDDYREVILLNRLTDAVTRLNPDASPEAREEAVRQVTQLSAPGLPQANRDFHRLLTGRVAVEVMRNGEPRGEQIELVDFDDPANNDFVAVNQFTILGEDERRPDIVLFVNGLPLAVIELKNLADVGATTEKAYTQLQTYQAKIPRLFHYNELLMISDGATTAVGAVGAGEEHFIAWKTIDGETISQGAPLEVAIKGIFAPRRFLDLVRSFIVFEDDGSRLTKKIARYHQFHAVRKALDTAFSAASPNGSRKGGVLWHTQGSGKSLTMLFFAGKLARHPAMQNPTIVMLTDRIDLDDQLFGTFAMGKDVLGQVPEQAQSRPHLRQLLQRGQGGVIFTTIQKFLPTPEEDEHPLLSDRRNIIVMADEAHRTQYGFGATYGASTGRFARGLAQHMRDALPNATFVAFTGTPLSLADRDTQVVFGDYIDVYDIGRAIEDGATVPIYYESRLVKLDLSDEQADLLDQGFEEITEDQEEEQKQKTSSRWSQQEKVVGTPKRIREVAEDLVQHYEGRQAGNTGKVMIVAYSRGIAVDLYDELVRLQPEWHGDTDDTGILKVVMTGSATDDQKLQPHIRNKERRERLADRFKDPHDHFSIVIVRDMWLTGFDAPSLHTIYIDKPMKGHGLMQAIARVNRVFEQKEGGLVVDYLGLADNLRAALRSYIREDQEQEGTERPPIENTTLKIEQHVAVMREKLELCREAFVGFDYRLFLNGTPSERVTVLADALDFLFGRDGRERRERGNAYIQHHGSVIDRFRDHALALQKAFSIVSATKDAQAAMKEITFFLSLKAAIDKTTGTGAGKSGKDLDAALRQLVDQAIAPEGVVDIFATAGLPKPDIGILSDAFLAEVRDLPQRNLALELLRKLLNDEISAQKRTSVVQAKRFSERLEASLARYHNRAIEMSEIIDALIALAQEMNEASKRGEALGLTKDEVAFYDALAANDSAVDVIGDLQLRAIAAEVTKTVRNNATIDWTVRETARANLRRLVRRVLRKHGYPPDKQEAATDLVIEQAELLGAEWAA